MMPVSISEGQLPISVILGRDGTVLVVALLTKAEYVIY
jgi:hypothetical protein